MEEKKLTDDEIVKALECCKAGVEVPCRECPLFKFGRTCQKHMAQEAIDLIHRLKDELKKELADHEEFTKKAKEEIERLTAKYRNLEINYNATWEDYRKYEVENAELQKQADELKELNAKYLDSIESLTVGKCVLRCELTKQAVKDTAKEIFEAIFNDCWAIKDENGQRVFVESIIRHIAKERYGV